MPSNALFLYFAFVTFLRFACQATEYANVENDFFKINNKGTKIIHDTLELICSYSGSNQWCHHFICELLDLYKKRI